MELAERAVKLADSPKPEFLETLAEAYATAGRFSEAAATAQQALTLALSRHDAKLTEALRSRIQRYKAGAPSARHKAVGRTQCANTLAATSVFRSWEIDYTASLPMKRRKPSELPESLLRSSRGRSTSAGRGTTILAAGLIVLATAAAFSSSFGGVFAFDDMRAILRNSTIRRLWPIWTTLSPPRGGETVTGRPLLNLSLAINYASSGYKVWSYHAANLAVHILGALLLFGIVRRTFLLPTMRDRWGAVAVPLAFAD